MRWFKKEERDNTLRLFLRAEFYIKEGKARADLIYVFARGVKEADDVFSYGWGFLEHPWVERNIKGDSWDAVLRRIDDINKEMCKMLIKERGLEHGKPKDYIKEVLP